MKITFRDIVWFAVVALIMVYLSKCHRDETQALDNKIVSLTEQSRSRDSIHAVDSMQDESKLNGLKDRLQNATEKQQVVDKQLTQSFVTIDRLAAAVKMAKLFTGDTTFVTVGPDYVIYCDSLAMYAEGASGEFNAYKTRTNYLLLAKDTAIRLQDSMLQKERAYSAAGKRDFNALQHFYTEAQRLNKPHNQVYIGAELMGTQQTLISNVGLALSLKTKTNKLWQVSSGIQTNGLLYARVNGNILIRLHKN
jgi:hypothetical protein